MASGRANWTVLGAGSILPRADYGPSGYALRPEPGAPVTLFDCGPGTVRSLAAAGIEIAEVRRVVITHFHPDHMLDLFALAFARHNPGLSGLGPIEIIGPVGTVKRLEGVPAVLGNWAGFPDASVVEVQPGAEPQTLDDESANTSGSAPGTGTARAARAARGMLLRWVRTRHTDTSIAWRADLEGGASVTYTGDTCDVPEVAALAQGTDLFVAECSFADADATPNHLTPTSAASLARQAGAKRLLLTHFYPSLDPEEARAVAAQTFDGPIELARDGSVHRFG